MRTYSLAGFVSSEDGQDLVEYAMVVAVMCLGLVASFRGVQNDIGNLFNQIEGYF